MHRFILLNKSEHDRSTFLCGVDELDEYLKKYSIQDMKSKLNKVFVSLEQNNQLSGFYTLSPTSFQRDNLSLSEQKKLQLNSERFRQCEFKGEPAQRIIIREHRRIQKNSLVSSDRDDAVPYYPLPGILIGKLAVDMKYQGLGIGSELLIDALKRIYIASKNVFGIYAVIVEAKNDKAKLFYEHFGFINFHNKPKSLYLPIKTIEILLSK
ncbi:GNAT family N-acetyltransferase [Rickettsia endosymbiont of Ceutorhynchus obstrictus]|uniref:GNAT family N-acetyltransferase n=1 Tax=unclassified Rickettsia TaxID=114295 RepID=UPI0039795818